MHLQAAAAGHPGIRLVDQWFDSAIDRLEEKIPTARRRIRDEAHNRKRAIADRMKVSAQSHGWSQEEYAINQPQTRQPNLDYRDQPVTPRTMQQQTLAAFGEGVSAEQAATRSQRNSEYIASLKTRTQGTDRRPGAAVRVNREASDYRYADRRAG
jgi:hypothetical protein